jgi:uncharacterized membrane protein
MRKKIASYFLQGLFYVAPLGLTIYIIYNIIVFFDNLFFNITDKHVPGIGFMLMILVIIVIGFLANTFLARPAINVLNSLITHMPIVRDLYLPLKDFFAALVGKERKFNRPVLVCINKENKLYKIGFLTEENINNLDLPDNFVSVYFPHSYAFSGELYITSKENIRMLDIPASVAMKFILSGGAINLLNESN